MSWSSGDDDYEWLNENEKGGNGQESRSEAPTPTGYSQLTNLPRSARYWTASVLSCGIENRITETVETLYKLSLFQERHLIWRVQYKNNVDPLKKV